VSLRNNSAYTELAIDSLYSSEKLYSNARIYSDCFKLFNDRLSGFPKHSEPADAFNFR